MTANGKEYHKVLVLGSGNFGTCLADHLADVSHDVEMWSRDEKVVESINKKHKNPKYLKDAKLSDSLKAIGPDMPDARGMRSYDMILFAIPSQHMRSILQRVIPSLDKQNLPLLVFVNKGIENNTNYLPLDVIKDEVGEEVAKVSVFLSGPSFAKEIVTRQPTQVSVSSQSMDKATAVSHVFHQPHFRCYPNDDPIGVEVAGAIKNVYAICAGVAEGLGFQSNTRAGLITRCLAEMTRIGVAMGADPLTFLSLAGVGDLFLTCSSTNSRNFTVGNRLGKGEKLDHIIETLGSVAEGVETSKGLHAIVAKLNIRAPIAEQVWSVLHNGASAKEMAEELMKLPVMVEHEGSHTDVWHIADTRAYPGPPSLCPGAETPLGNLPLEKNPNFTNCFKAQRAAHKKSHGSNRTSRANAPQPLLKSKIGPKRNQAKGKGSKSAPTKSTQEKASKPESRKHLNAYSYEQQDSRRELARAKAKPIEDRERDFKRRKVANEEAADEDEEEDEEDQPWKMHNLSDDEGGLEGDDEEIDSDHADTDGEGAPKSAAKGKAKAPAIKKPQKKQVTFSADIDLNEDDGDPRGFESEISEKNDFMDLSELLDRSDTPTDSDADSNEDSMDEDDADRIEELDRFIQDLPITSSKRKDGESSGTEPRKRRRMLEEQGEAYEEGIYGSVGRKEGERKVTLEDLLEGLPAAQSAALRKTFKPLIAKTSLDETDKAINPLKRRGALPAPLPLLHQAKLDRQAATEILKTHLDQWNDTQRSMRGLGKTDDDGERRLVLPLGPSASNFAPTGADLQAKFTATTDLERSVQSLLAAGGLTSKNIRATEDDALAALAPEDRAARQAELRHTRELLFRAERKAARVGKIKSKAYRRVHRRAELKAAQEAGAGALSMDQMTELDAIDGGDRALLERERLEIQRARERATLRHASKRGGGGQWANTMGTKSDLDDESRRALDDRASREALLRQKILGRNDAVSEEEEETDEDEMAGAEDIKAAAFDELASFEAREAQKAESAPVPKGLLGMKFMQRAMAARQTEADALEQDLRNDLDQMDNENAPDTVDEPDSSSHNVSGSIGRFVFRATKSAPESAPESKQTSGTSEHKTRLGGVLELSVPLPSQAKKSASAIAEANPWLTPDSTSIAVSKKKNTMLDGESSKADRSNARLIKDRSRTKDAQQTFREEAEIVIDVNDTLKLGADDEVTANPKSKKRKNRRNKGKAAASKGSHEASAVTTMSAAQESDESESEADEPKAVGRGLSAIQQRDLVARAFADDNVVSAFEAEKDKEMELDAPQEQDLTLPGWGSWGGKGIRKAKGKKDAKPKFVKHIAGVLPTARRDAGMAHVIINEKRDRKSVKYLVKDLPYPYTSAAQFEHALNKPLGREWTTALTHRNAITPSVILKAGRVIEPISKDDIIES